MSCQQVLVSGLNEISDGFVGRLRRPHDVTPDHLARERAAVPHR